MVRWPGLRHEGGAGGGSCAEAEGEGGAREAAGAALRSLGTQIVPSSSRASRPRPWWWARQRQVCARLHVSSTPTPRASSATYDVDFERIGPKLRGKITASRKLGGTFVAFIPGNWAARDDLENRLDLRALQGTGKLKVGPLVRKDRRDSRAAQSRCAPLQPNQVTINPNDPPNPKEVERALALHACMERRSPPAPSR